VKGCEWQVGTSFLLRGIALVCLTIAGCISAEQALFYDGEKHIRQLEYKEAYDMFSRYISLCPKSSEGYFNRGLAATGLDSLAEAEADFARAILLDPTNTDARWMRYRILASYRESRAGASEVAKLGRSVQQTMISALTVLMMEDLNMILEIDPFDIAVRAERGALLQKLGRYTEAKRDFDMVLLNSPKDVRTLNERGRLMDELGDYEGALNDYNKALELCDTCTWLLYNKALSLKASGQVVQAAEVLKELIVADSLDGEAWLLLGECRILAGQRDEACAALFRSLELGVDQARELLEELCW
jgi:tetratricopeptide (TPR) repeat protein